MIMRSDILDVVASQVAIVYGGHCTLGITTSASLHPAGLHSSSRAGSEEIHSRKAVEFFQVAGATLRLEGLQHN